MCRNSRFLFWTKWGIFFAGICTCCSLTMTSSHWRTGFLTLKPIRCPSFTRAACRKKPHRKKLSQNDSEHPKNSKWDSHRCAQSHKYSKHQLNAGPGASFKVLASFQGRVVSFILIVNSFSLGYRPVRTSFFCGQSKQTWLFVKRAPFSFLLSSVRKPDKIADPNIWEETWPTYGPYC